MQRDRYTPSYLKLLRLQYFKKSPALSEGEVIQSKPDNHHINTLQYLQKKDAPAEFPIYNYVWPEGEKAVFRVRHYVWIPTEIEQLKGKDIGKWMVEEFHITLDELKTAWDIAVDILRGIA